MLPFCVQAWVGESGSTLVFFTILYFPFGFLLRGGELGSTRLFLHGCAAAGGPMFCCAGDRRRMGLASSGA